MEAKRIALGPDIEAWVDEADAASHPGVVHWRVRSPYQPGTPRVRIVAPDGPAPRRVLFVLPVEAEPEKKWGDGFETVRKLGVPQWLGFVVVAPSFAQWPWYCDHPKDRTRWQETYMLKAVVPLAERLYPHEARHRALLGFSKSGWGAWSLLLRHPEEFGAAAAWDAPMMMPRPGYGIPDIAGTLKNFKQYRIPRLLEEHADAVRGTKRLALLGYGNFRSHHVEAHALLERLGIPHDYADGPKRKHHWDSGWVEEAVEALHKMLPLEQEKPDEKGKAGTQEGGNPGEQKGRGKE